MNVWCPGASEAALSLARALGGRKMRRMTTLQRWLMRERGRKMSLLLMSPFTAGMTAPLLEHVNLLNGRMCWDKLLQHHVMRGAGIPTLDVLPYAPDGEWVGRTRRHSRGDDFLQTIEPDYFTRKVEVVKEFRFHIIGGRSVKGGGKVPVEGEEVHPWVRSRQFGWKVDYGPLGREGITAGMREMAKEASAVLQMDAGAVDVWQLAGGSNIVGEVNVRPGMDEPTVVAWATALKEMEDGD